jgi:hypothetical protein
MSLIKRITILAALAAMTAGMGGCTTAEEVLRVLGRCPPEGPCPTPEPDPEAEPSPPVLDPAPPFIEPSTASAGRRGKALRARFTAKSITPPVVFEQPGRVGATNLVSGGRFSGSLVGDSSGGRRFSSGRWISRGELNYKIRSRKFTGDAYMLLRFRRRGAGSLCLSVGIKAAGIKRGEVNARGSFIALGGTGEGAKIVGRGSFSQQSDRSTGRLRARGRLRIGTARPLPALCAALARLR